MEEVILTFNVFWRFKEYHHIKITRRKMIINTQTNTLLKYHTRGYYIKGVYVKKKDLNGMIEKIPTREFVPF